MPSSSRSTTKTLQPIRKAARKLGLSTLRPGQEEAIAGVLGGSDVLAVMPTGSGKSAIYQIAAQLLPGLTLVVSPLLALQKDQLESLEGHDVGEAAALSSMLSSQERNAVLESLQRKRIEFLFLAPEQLEHDALRQQLKAASPVLIVIDEAHCVVEWGHDFRPSYAKLDDFIEMLGRPRVLALTATAAPPIRDAIVQQLKLREPEIFVHGFDRPNIYLGVRRFDDAESKRRALLEDAHAFLQNGQTPGIVYCATRRSAEEISAALEELGDRALPYHAGLKKSEREAAQNSFMGGECECIVATNAFGMGVDKANVRWVLHHDIADSPDAYYQEIGRAGRDGKPSSAILYYEPKDLNLHRFFAGGGKLEPNEARQIAQSTRQIMENSNRDIAADHLERTLRAETGVAASKIKRVVRALEQSDTNKSDMEALLQDVAEQEAQRKEFEQSRLEMMRSYAELESCRRAFLLSYFGEEYSAANQHCCDNCDHACATIQPAADSGDAPFAIKSRVSHSEWGEGEVLRYESDKVIILFDKVGYKTLATEVVVENDLLTACSREARVLALRGGLMPNLRDDQPLQSGFTQQLDPSSNGRESDEATFQLDEDDPGRVDNRGGLEAVLADDQNSSESKLNNNDSTIGLVAPAGQPGGDVGPTDSASGAIDPQIEMSSVGVVDAEVADLSEANDQPRDANDDEPGP